MLLALRFSLTTIKWIQTHFRSPYAKRNQQPNTKRLTKNRRKNSKFNMKSIFSSKYWNQWSVVVIQWLLYLTIFFCPCVVPILFKFWFGYQIYMRQKGEQCVLRNLFWRRTFQSLPNKIYILEEKNVVHSSGLFWKNSRSEYLHIVLHYIPRYM